MKNKYAATCSQCGNRVAPGEGETNKVGSLWVTSHIGGCKSLAAPSFERGGEGYYFDEEWEDSMWYGMTSEDVNPDEGCK